MRFSRLNRLKHAFGDALELPTAERTAFARRECGSDESLLIELCRMLELRRRTMAGVELSPLEFETASAEGLDRAADVTERALPVAGTVLAGRYELIERIGAGGFGEVHRALDRVRDEEVAVKVFVSADPRRHRLFRREVNMLRRARVPGVVELLHEGRQEPWSFVVMALARGTAFPGRIEASDDRARTILARGAALLSVLDGMHAAGVIHRDLKPENVLVDDDGRVTLVDLGIAEDETEVGQVPVAGTPGFMAPELAPGVRAAPQVDLYAVGAMLLDALGPEEAEFGPQVSRATQAAMLREHVQLPSGVHEALTELVAEDPAARPACVAEVLERFRAAGLLAAGVELPRAGGGEIVDRVLLELSRGRSVQIGGARGHGRTRLLDDVAAALREQGRATLRLEGRLGAALDLDRLVSPIGLPPASRPTERDDEVRRRVELQLESGAALLVDDADHCDPSTLEWLDDVATRQAIVRVSERFHAGPVVRVGRLEIEDLRALFGGSDRLLPHGRRAAEWLFERTRGVPLAVRRELEAWIVAGVVRGPFPLAVNPDGLSRLRGMQLGPLPSGVQRTNAGLHHDERTIWSVLCVAAGACATDVLAVVAQLPLRRVHAALLDLERRGVVVVEDDECAWPVLGCPQLPSVPVELRRTWVDRLAEADTASSPIRFQRWVVAEEWGRAAELALELAPRLARAGDTDTAVGLLDTALVVARTHQPEQTTLYGALAGALAEAAVGRGTRRALDLAAYHLESAPERDGAIRNWERIVAAAADCLRREYHGALARLDEIEHLVDEGQRALFHSVAVLAARRSGDADERRRRLAEAARWVRRSRTREARRMFAAWLGWLRFDEGRFAAAARLQARAAARSRDRRSTANNWSSAAMSALEAGDIARAELWSRRALEVATSSMDVVNRSRAERVLRATAYRSGRRLEPDLALVAEARDLDPGLTRGMVLFTEAAIAWRAGQALTACEALRAALPDLRRDRSPAIAMVAHALLAVCGGAVTDELIAFVDGAPLDGPPGLVAQAAALAGSALGPERISDDLLERAIRWADGASYPAQRREVLSPVEVQRRLAAVAPQGEGRRR